MTASDALAERIAIALYEVSGGDLDVFPWPCKKADHYRRLARIAAGIAIRQEDGEIGVVTDR